MQAVDGRLPRCKQRTDVVADDGDHGHDDAAADDDKYDNCDGGTHGQEWYQKWGLQAEGRDIGV